MSNDYIKSSIITFISTFLLTVMAQINAGNISLDKASIIAILLVGVRAGIKSITDYLMTPVKVGKTKQKKVAKKK